MYNNLFVNHLGNAIRIQPHNDVPRLVDVFYNTIIASGMGISLVNREDGSPYTQQIAGNAIFAASPLAGYAKKENLDHHYEDASKYLIQPVGPLGKMNITPLPGKLKFSSIDMNRFGSYLEWNMDFDGYLRSVEEYGAYTGKGLGFRWLPKLEVKPGFFGDTSRN